MMKSRPGLAWPQGQNNNHGAYRCPHSCRACLICRLWHTHQTEAWGYSCSADAQQAMKVTQP